jgi:hypothetical protein
MHARSATRTITGVLLAGLILGGSVGCSRDRNCILDCRPKKCTSCPAAADSSPTPAVPKPAYLPKADVKMLPDGKGPVAAAFRKPTVVETHEPAPILQKVPVQAVDVRDVSTVAVKAPQPIAAAAPAPVIPQATVTHVPMNRARLAFTFDFVHLPVPFIRPVAIPTTPEYTFALPPQPAAPAAPAGFTPVTSPVVPASAQSPDEYCRQVDSLIQALEASKAAVSSRK